MDRGVHPVGRGYETENRETQNQGESWGVGFQYKSVYTWEF